VLFHLQGLTTGTAHPSSWSVSLNAAVQALQHVGFLHAAVQQFITSAHPWRPKAEKHEHFCFNHLLRIGQALLLKMKSFLCFQITQATIMKVKCPDFISRQDEKKRIGKGGGKSIGSPPLRTLLRRERQERLEAFVSLEPY
jgi:hypothetical protein